jgi:hypothetical protein
LNDSPGYNYCNHQNKTGQCCPPGSNHYDCIQNTAADVLCSFEENDYDMFYSYCLYKSEEQCGSEGLYLTVSDTNNISVSTQNLSWSQATTCLWQILTQESKKYVYSKTIILEFLEISNLNV